MFSELKKVFIEELGKHDISTQYFLDTIKQMPADEGGNKQFLECYLNELRQARDNSVLLGLLSFNMDYISYHFTWVFARKMWFKWYNAYDGRL